MTRTGDWRKTRLAAAFCAAGYLYAQLYAQRPPATAAEVSTRDSEPTFSAGVNLVLVPVVVRDSAGKAIGTLRREDFQLLDKNRPQFIAKFAIETPGTPLIVRSAGEQTDAAGRTVAGEKTASATVATRFVAWLFDDVHISVGDLMRGRLAAEKQLAALEPGARAGIFTTSGRFDVDFTDDREAMRTALNRILPLPGRAEGAAECPDISFFQADRMVNQNDQDALTVAEAEYVACNPPPSGITVQQAMQQAQGIVTGLAHREMSVGERDTRMALDVLRILIRRMSTLPGSRSVAIISPGFYLTVDHRMEESDIIDRAIRANVTISSLDARGLYTIVPGGDASTPAGLGVATGLKAQWEIESATANSDVMAEFAYATGGTFFHNNNDLDEGLKRIAAQPEFVYILGFSPDALKFDGSYHALKVLLTKEAQRAHPGYTLQARRGYFTQRHATDPAELAKQEVEEAFFSRDEIRELPVELHTQFFKTGEYKARLSILARVDAKHLRYRKADGRNQNTLTVVGGVFDRNGNYVNGTQKTVEMRLRDQTLEAMPDAGITVKSTLDLASGSYVVRLVVRDSEGSTMSAQNSLVEIP